MNVIINSPTREVGSIPRSIEAMESPAAQDLLDQLEHISDAEAAERVEFGGDDALLLAGFDPFDALVSPGSSSLPPNSSRSVCQRTISTPRSFAHSSIFLCCTSGEMKLSAVLSQA